MIRDIIRFTNEKGCAWITTPKGDAEEFIEYMKTRSRDWTRRSMRRARFPWLISLRTCSKRSGAS